MAPEFQLLWRLCKLLSHPGSERNLPPQGKISWNLFLRLVEKHRLGPLFSHRLTGNVREGFFPPEVRKAWEAEYHARLARTVLAQEALSRLLDLLGEYRIDSIVLKGAHLAEACYPHPALRPMDDIDLLIRPEDRLRFRETIGNGGWEFVSETPTALKLSGKGPGNEHLVFLEAHTDLQTPVRRNPAFDIRIDDFWARSLPATISGAPARVLDPTINLLYLSAHLAHHGFSRLIWFHDLHLIIENSGRKIDWEEAARKAASWRSMSQVYHALRWTGDLFGSAIPGGFLERLSPAAWKKPLVGIFLNRKRILKGELDRPVSPSLYERFMLNDDWMLSFRGGIFGYEKER